MKESKESNSTFTIETFTGDCTFMATDPYETAAKKATVKAQDWLDSFDREEDMWIKEVVSTQTLLIPSGDYAVCVITMVYEIGVTPYAEEEEEVEAV